MARTYDSIQHGDVLGRVQDPGLPELMVNVIEHMYRKSKVVANFQGVTSTEVDVCMVFSQGLRTAQHGDLIVPFTMQNTKLPRKDSAVPKRSCRVGW